MIVALKFILWMNEDTTACAVTWFTFPLYYFDSEDEIQNSPL